MIYTKHLIRQKILAVTAHCTDAMTAWRRWLPLGMAFGVPQLLRAENQVQYRYEYYNEDGNRMKIETHSVYFEQELWKKIIARGEIVYDGISGATPTGTHDRSGRAKTSKLWDLRRAGNLGVEWRFGDHKLNPGVSFSKEHDYDSKGVSLSDAIEFNEKNTTLQFGASHNFDSVRDGRNHSIWRNKESTDAMVGLSQLLSPRDVYSVAFTFGNDSGYLTDPYRAAEYHPDFFSPGITTAVPERRPAHRNKEILLNTFTHHFDSLNASLEGSYRFYHDSFGVFSHTVALDWHQRLGSHLIVEPMFRVSEQSAASFYTTVFEGPFTSDPAGYHSSDYRLSNFYSLDFGLQITAIINRHLRVNAGYHRYQMHGLDQTTQDMYPQANIVSVGLQYLW